LSERSRPSGLEPPTGFYKDKRVLVTGHTGFKGSWLTAWLVALGAEVAGLSLDDAAPNGLHRLCAHEERIGTMWVDVRDTERVRAAFGRYMPEIVFHLAGQAIVRQSYSDPIETLETNIMGTANVLDGAARAGSVRAIVCVSSDKCYGDAGGIRTEADPLLPSDPYSSSKAAAELIVRSYNSQAAWSLGPRNTGVDMAVAAARSGNAIGGGDWGADRLVPDVIRALRRGEPVQLRMPDAKRPWQHVLEPLAGYLILGAALAEGRTTGTLAYNFGPILSAHESVESLVRILLDVKGAPGYPVAVGAEKFLETDEVLIDSSLARRDLGWRPVWDLASAVQHTVEWYDLCDKADISELRELTTRQIREFTSDFGRLESGPRSAAAKRALMSGHDGWPL
jgi:CDP-glucose 4,6-dehydratase